MIFLDANAFYSYSGRKKLGLIESTHVDERKLSVFLDNTNEKSLPTSVFMEIMVHFRDDPQRLKEIVEFRENKHLTLFNNIPDYCITDDEITFVHYMDGSSLGNYAYKLFDEKIGVESRFAFLFYEISKDLYLEYRLSEINELTEQNKNGIWEFLGRKEYKENGDTIISEFCDALKDGYEQGKDENILKAKYIDKLNEACQFIDIILAGSIACKNEEADIISAVQKAYGESVSKGFDGNDGTMKGIVALFQTDAIFLEQAKKKIASMFLKHKYNKYHTDYLQSIMFTAWFDRAQKLRKNDIFDMMCAGCLDYVRPRFPGESILVNTESYIMSFDSTMEKFLENVRPNNIKIIQQYKR